MSIVRRFTGGLIALLIASVGNAPAFGQTKDGPPMKLPDDALSRAFIRYGEAMEGLGKKDPMEHYRTSEQEFRKALDTGVGLPWMRIRAWEELGALQGNLNEKEKSFFSFLQMEKEAEKEGDLISVSQALDNLFSRSKGFPFETREQVAKRYKNISVRIMSDEARMKHETVRKQVMAKYPVALGNVGKMFLEEGNEGIHSSDPVVRAKSEELLRSAETDLLEASQFDTEEPDKVARRLFYLAKVKSALGKKKEAADIFDSIAAMKQTSFSKLWMGELRVTELHPVSSPEYREKLSELVNEFDQKGIADEEGLNMKMHLAKAYRDAKDIPTSNEWLGKLLDQYKDPAANALVLELLVANYERLGDMALANELRRELLDRFPNTPSGIFAKRRVDEAEKARQAALESLERRKALQQRQPKTSLSGWLFYNLIGLSLLTVGVLLFRQRTSQTATVK